MRWKKLTIKILIYLSLIVVLTGIVFCVGYRARHPVSSSHAAQGDQRQANQQVMGVQERNASPQREQGANEQSYAAKWFEPITILTLLLVAGIVVTNCIYWGQLKKMRETVGLIGKQGETMEGQLAVMRDQLGAMQGQVAVAGKQADLTAKQIDLMVLSECAYIRVSDMDIPPIRNFDLIIMGKLHNGGRTPAWNLTREFRVGFAQVGFPPPPFQWTDGESKNEGSLIADAELKFGTEPLRINKVMFDAIQNRQAVIHFDGECRYFDGIGGSLSYTFGFTLEYEIAGGPLVAVERYQYHKRKPGNPN